MLYFFLVIFAILNYFILNFNKNMTSSIRNLYNPLKTGATNLNLMGSGKEFFGTVIKHGKIDKTVTVINKLI